MAGIAEATVLIEMRTLEICIGLDGLVSEALPPFIVPWQPKLFVEVYKTLKTKIFTADPAQGFRF